MLEAVHIAAYSGVALLLLLPVGNWLCAHLLRATGLQQAMEAKRARTIASPDAPTFPEASPQPPTVSLTEPRVGALIGDFERALLAFGILIGSWEVLGAIIALKTVARFKELDEKLDAEYFLVGSLFSLGWGLLITAAWIGYDKHLGADVSGQISAIAHSLKGKG